MRVTGVRITVFCSAIVIDVIVHCHTAGALLSQSAEKQLSLSSCGWVLIRSSQLKITWSAMSSILPRTIRRVLERFLKSLGCCFLMILRRMIDLPVLTPLIPLLLVVAWLQWWSGESRKRAFLDTASQCAQVGISFCPLVISCTHVDRTGLEFNLSFVSLQNKNSSHRHLDVKHGSGASPLRLPVC